VSVTNVIATIINDLNTFFASIVVAVYSVVSSLILYMYTNVV